MKRALKRALALATLLGVAIPQQPAHAQGAEHDRVRAVVTGLFDAMRGRDTAAMRAAFDTTVALQSVGPDGIRVDPLAGWLASVAGAREGVVLDERLGEPVVQVDGPLATVWVRYHFFVGERFSHCGVDAFVLARVADAWRIISVADTRQREGCQPLGDR